MDQGSRLIFRSCRESVKRDECPSSGRCLPPGWPSNQCLLDAGSGYEADFQKKPERGALEERADWVERSSCLLRPLYSR
jgi:hypothetical protein